LQSVMFLMKKSRPLFVRNGKRKGIDLVDNLPVVGLIKVCPPR
jgi:hypothetical protein